MTLRQPTRRAAEITRDKVLRDTFDAMALLLFEQRAGYLTAEQVKARIEAVYPRMHWLYYDAFTVPPGEWRPAYYGLPKDEPLIKPKGTTQ